MVAGMVADKVAGMVADMGADRKNISAHGVRHGGPLSLSQTERKGHN